MLMKPRHPATVKRCEETRRSLPESPRIPRWLDEELERELTAPCPLFRTSFVRYRISDDAYPGWYNRQEDWWKAIR